MTPLLSPTMPASTLKTPAAAAKTAQKFEAMVIGAMLKPMFKTVGKADAPFGGGMAGKEFEPMFISAIAKEMEARGGLGLKPAIEAAMAAKPGVRE